MLLLIFPVFCCGAVNVTDLQGWQLVIPETASEAEIFAAEQFQTFLAQSTDINLPVKQGGNTGKLYSLDIIKLWQPASD